MSRVQNSVKFVCITSGHLGKQMNVCKKRAEILFKISPIIHWWRHIGSLNKFKLYGKHTQLSFRISCSSWNFEAPLLWQIFVLVLRVFFYFLFILLSLCWTHFSLMFCERLNVVFCPHSLHTASMLMASRTEVHDVSYK